MEIKLVMAELRLREAIQDQNMKWFFDVIDGKQGPERNEHFLSFLNCHRVLGLAGHLNADFAKKNKSHRQQVLCESLKKCAELMTIKKRFDEASIRFFVLKGMALSQFLYQDFSVRQSCDIDILIEPQNSLAANEILRELGYTNEFGYDVTEKNINIIQSRSHDVQYINQAKQVKVECHFKVRENNLLFAESFENLWQRRQVIDIQSQAFNFFSMNDLLIYLCMHGAHHFYTKLSWLMDVAELIKRFEFDFDAILSHAYQLNCERLVAVSIVLASELMNQPVPKLIQDAYQKDHVAARLRKWSLIGLQGKMMKNNELIGTFLQLYLVNRKGYKITCLKKRLRASYHGVLKHNLPHWVLYIMPVVDLCATTLRGLRFFSKKLLKSCAPVAKNLFLVKDK